MTHMSKQTTTDELFRNFVAATAVLTVVTFGAMIWMELLR
jgi:hypothetical protein